MRIRQTISLDFSYALMYIHFTSNRRDKTMSNKQDVDKIAKVAKKTSRFLKSFNDAEDFVALHNAVEYMKAKGYSVGRLCRDEPIACVRGQISYIAKWYNISMEEWPRIDALIVADDTRNGKVFCYEFV